MLHIYLDIEISSIVYLDVKIFICSLREMANDGEQTDHVARVHALWRRELPDVTLDGSAILARARRITLMAREKIVPVLSRHGLDGGEFYVLAALRRARPALCDAADRAGLGR